MCLKDSCLPDCWKVSLVVPVFRNAEKGLLLNTTTFFLWLVKSLKNFCNRFVDHIQKFGLIYDTAVLLTVLSDRIATDINRSRATRVIALDISKAFDRVWHAGLFHKFKSELQSDL